MKSKQIAVFISGGGSNLRALFNASKQYPHAFPYHIAAVLSDQNCAGLNFASDHHIPYHILEPNDRILDSNSVNKNAERTILKNIDLIVFAGFMRIARPNFIDSWKRKIINIHPSLLPAFPGLNTHQRVYDSQADTHGCTVHYIDHGIDTGPIIAQAGFKVEKNQSVTQLAQKVLSLEHLLFPRALAQVIRKENNLHKEYYQESELITSLYLPQS